MNNDNVCKNVTQVTEEDAQQEEFAEELVGLMLDPSDDAEKKHVCTDKEEETKIIV